MSAKLSSLILSVFVTVAFAPAAHAAEPRFVDAETYFTTSEIGRSLLPDGFWAAEQKLAEQFDAACPDAFCEGIVGNWAPLSFSCTVDAEHHVVGECVWTFAGSFEEVDAQTGKLTVFHENRTCDLGLQGDATALAEFLTRASEAKGHAFGLLAVRIPGRSDGLALFDVLSACF